MSAEQHRSAILGGQYGRAQKSVMRRLVRITAFAAALFVLVLSGLGAWVGYLQLSGNFHVVEPGLVYRANTLGRDQLIDVLQQNGIRTIVNLRGAAEGDGWYDDEAAVAREQDVTLIDIPMADDQAPEPQVMAALIEALRTARRPLLIHCKAGADRTGLASALFELLVMRRPAQVASGQLSLAYGHFPWLGSRTAAMDETFWKVAESD